MLFNLEQDSGDKIVGYCVPDGFSALPKLRVCAGGEGILEFAANEIRESLVVAGRHETGRCGFGLDTAILPNLQSLTDLEIFDVDTGLLIYRRPAPNNIQQKLIRIETHLFPLWALDNAVGKNFQYYWRGIETLGRETVSQLLLLANVRSIFLSGRILFKNYAYYIDGGFRAVICIQNPYEELAERLLVLSKLKKFGTWHLGERDAAIWAPAIDFASALDFRNERACARAFRQAPNEIIALFSNPIVRQLTGSTPDEMPTGSAVGSALDVLADAALVGLRHESNLFMNDFAGLLGLDPRSLPTLPKFAPVAGLARMLRESREADPFLAKDLELYDYIVNAFNKAPQKLIES